MSTKIAAVALTLALAGVVYGIFASSESGSLRRELEVARTALDTARDDLDVATQRVQRLEQEQAALRRQVAQLLAQLQQPIPAVAPATPLTSDDKPPVQIAEGTRSFGVQSVEEADAVAAELGRRGDIEGLWILASELLALGEPGFEKLIELAAILDQQQGPMREALQQLWRHEELIAGRFMQTVMANTEQVLKLGLYLDRHQGQLPELLRDFDRELEDEMGVMLLGMYSGNDAEVLEGYTDRLEAKINEDFRRSTDAVRALGEIRTERSTDVLLSLLDRAEGRMLDTVVQALAWQRDARALAALTRLRVTVTDPARGRVIDAAIRYLE